MTEASQVFISSLKKHCIPNCVSYTTKTIISIITSTPFEYIKLTTDESYYLKITTNGNKLIICIYFRLFESILVNFISRGSNSC